MGGKVCVTQRYMTIQHPTAVAATNKAETTTIEDKLSGKTTVLEEIELQRFIYWF